VVPQKWIRTVQIRYPSSISSSSKFDGHLAGHRRAKFYVFQFEFCETISGHKMLNCGGHTLLGCASPVDLC